MLATSARVDIDVPRWGAKKAHVAVRPHAHGRSSNDFDVPQAMG